MTTQYGKLLSASALVVAGVVAGVLIAAGSGVTTPASAERPAPAAAVEAPGSFPDFAALAERVVPSVVSVYSTDIVQPGERRRGMPSDPFEFFFGPRQGPQRPRDQEPMIRRGAGSGFFITEDGELLTNNHVVETADKVEIELDDGTRYRVSVVGRDSATDLAVVKVDQPDRKFPPLPFGDSAALRVGEWVMAVGNPLNMEHTVTVGVVSAKGRVLGISDSSFENFIQTDAAINFGNSGGPLVNLRGEVVAINTAINAGGQNLGFAVPIETARRILPQLRTSGKVVRGYLGIQVSNVDDKKQQAFKLPDRTGAFVEEVIAGFAAAKAGLEPGDLVVMVDGETVTDTRHLIDAVSANAPGTDIRLEVIRNGKRVKLTVTLDERPGAGRDASPSRGDNGDAENARVGVSVSELTPRLRQQFGVDRELEGVVVTSVDPVSPAGEEGLRRGDVITQANGLAVATPADFREAVSGVEPGGYLRLYVYRPRADQSFFVILQLQE